MDRENTQLISPNKGSWFFLGELFTSLPLAYDHAIRDRCGQCDLCLKACPTGAFIGPIFWMRVAASLPYDRAQGFYSTSSETPYR